MRRFLGRDPPGITFVLPGPDEAGARILGEMRDRAVNLVADALAQSSDHIQSFFEALRTELAFYIGCLNLHEALRAAGAPTCLPEPGPPGSGGLRLADLRDVGLVLSMGGGVVGNTVNADGRRLIIVTGANQGGKSSFLRAVGLAQLMMQCGMFVPAQSFAAEIVPDIFTHFKREEDKAMVSGKFDEELSRMSRIIDAMAAGAAGPLLLLNESFASTDSREGSEIARQVVRALVERRTGRPHGGSEGAGPASGRAGAKVVFVTHLYEFAHGMYEEGRSDALFLRASRLPDGTRPFRLLGGEGGPGSAGAEPLESSYGQDLYREVFGADPAGAHAGSSPADSPERQREGTAAADLAEGAAPGSLVSFSGAPQRDAEAP